MDMDSVVSSAANDMSDAGDSFPPDLSFEPEPVSYYDPKDSTGKRALILLGLTFGGLLLLGILVFRLYGDGTKTRDDIPSIRADDTPFKEVFVEGEAPTEPTREVYSALDGSETPDVIPAPEPEAPTTPRAGDLPDTMTVEVEPVRPVATGNAQPEPFDLDPVQPEPEPVTASPEPVVTTPPVSSASGGSSDWVVQVASLRSEGEARETYNRVAAKFAGALPTSGYADIQRADLAEKGIYYRVRVAGLRDKAAANQLCNSFKAGGQACFVTKR